MSDSLILVAMNAERDALRRRLIPQAFWTHSRLGISVDICGIGPGRRILICSSFVGLASAAIATVIVAERFEVTSVILLGVGGALREDVDLGDTIIGERSFNTTRFMWVRSVMN